MPDSPPPPKKPEGKVLPFSPRDKKTRRDQTVPFETERSKRKKQAHIFGKPRDTLEMPSPAAQQKEVLPNLPRKEFSPGQRIVGFMEQIHEAYIILNGRASLYGIKSSGDLMDHPIYTLTEGEIINSLVLSEGLDTEVNSQFMVTAKTEVEVMVVQPNDMLGVATDQDEQLLRTRFFMKVLTQYVPVAMQRRVREWEAESDYENALQSEQSRNKSLSAELAEHKVRFEELHTKMKSLDDALRKITKDAVNEVLVRRLKDLEKTNRVLRRTVRERRAEVQSAQSIIGMLYDELEELEKKQSLTGMSHMNPDEILSILTNIYMVMMRSENEQLRQLGFHGMTQIHSLRMKIDIS